MNDLEMDRVKRMSNSLVPTRRIYAYDENIKGLIINSKTQKECI